MKFDPKIHHRHSIRLAGYDYTQPGAYFITTVIARRERLLGEITNGTMKRSRFGEIVHLAMLDLPRHYPQVHLDVFCIMPNHVHGILVFAETALGVTRRPLSEIARAFKSFSAARINQIRGTPGQPVWQRNYYEHIIRNEKEYQAVCEYIQSNPLQWEQDVENLP